MTRSHHESTSNLFEARDYAQKAHAHLIVGDLEAALALYESAKELYLQVDFPGEAGQAREALEKLEPELESLRARVLAIRTQYLAGIAKQTGDWENAAKYARQSSDLWNKLDSALPPSERVNSTVRDLYRAIGKIRMDIDKRDWSQASKELSTVYTVAETLHPKTGDYLGIIVLGLDAELDFAKGSIDSGKDKLSRTISELGNLKKNEDQAELLYSIAGRLIYNAKRAYARPESVDLLKQAFNLAAQASALAGEHGLIDQYIDSRAEMAGILMYIRQDEAAESIYLELMPLLEANRAELRKDWEVEFGKRLKGKSPLEMIYEELSEGLIRVNIAIKFLKWFERERQYASVVNTYANSLFAQNRMDECASYYERAQEAMEWLADRNMILNSYISLANVYYSKKQFREATSKLEMAMSVAQDRHDHSSLSQVHKSLGNIAYSQENWNEAKKQFEISAENLDVLEPGPAIAHMYLDMGKKLRLIHDIQGSAKYLEKARASFEALSDRNGIHLAEQELSRIQ